LQSDLGGSYFTSERKRLSGTAHMLAFSDK